VCTWFTFSFFFVSKNIIRRNCPKDDGKEDEEEEREENQKWPVTGYP